MIHDMMNNKQTFQMRISNVSKMLSGDKKLISTCIAEKTITFCSEVLI